MTWKPKNLENLSFTKHNKAVREIIDNYLDDDEEKMVRLLGVSRDCYINARKEDRTFNEIYMKQKREKEMARKAKEVVESVEPTEMVEIASKKKRKIKKAVKKTAKAKIAKPKKVKSKKYAVKGHVVIADGKVVSKSKGILKVARGRKDKSNEYVISFLVKAK